MKGEINAIICDKDSKKEINEESKHEKSIQYGESYPIR